MRSRVTIASRGIAHHGARSGYDRLTGALRGKLPVRLVDGSGGPRLPSLLSQRVTARTGMRWYDDTSLRMDLSVVRALWQRETCHLLYGEDALHFCAQARRLGAPGRLVATFHQTPELLEAVLPDTRSLQRLDGAIALSRELRDHLAGLVGEERAFFVSHGVDTDFFKPSPEPIRNPLSCLFVGWWQRDFEVLGAVVRHVRSRLPAVRFDAVVPAGAAKEVRLKTGIKPLVQISDAELLRRYQQTTAVLLPLTSATANNALLEAASCAVPVVITDVGGVRDYVDDACAELVPPSDAEAMSHRLLALLSDPSRREQLGRKARARALAFDWGRVAEQHLRVYERVSSAHDRA